MSNDISIYDLLIKFNALIREHKLGLERQSYYLMREDAVRVCFDELPALTFFVEAASLFGVDIKTIDIETELNACGDSGARVEFTITIPLSGQT